MRLGTVLALGFIIPSGYSSALPEQGDLFSFNQQFTPLLEEEIISGGQTVSAFTQQLEPVFPDLAPSGPRYPAAGGDQEVQGDFAFYQLDFFLFLFGDIGPSPIFCGVIEEQLSPLTVQGNIIVDFRFDLPFITWPDGSLPTLRSIQPFAIAVNESGDNCFLSGSFIGLPSLGLAQKYENGLFLPAVIRTNNLAPLAFGIQTDPTFDPADTRSGFEVSIQVEATNLTREGLLSIGTWDALWSADVREYRSVNDPDLTRTRAYLEQILQNERRNADLFAIADTLSGLKSLSRIASVLRNGGSVSALDVQGAGSLANTTENHRELREILRDTYRNPAFNGTTTGAALAAVEFAGQYTPLGIVEDLSRSNAAGIQEYLDDPPRDDFDVVTLPDGFDPPPGFEDVYGEFAEYVDLSVDTSQLRNALLLATERFQGAFFAGPLPDEAGLALPQETFNDLSIQLRDNAQSIADELGRLQDISGLFDFPDFNPQDQALYQEARVGADQSWRSELATLVEAQEGIPEDEFLDTLNFLFRFPVDQIVDVVNDPDLQPAPTAPVFRPRDIAGADANGDGEVNTDDIQFTVEMVIQDSALVEFAKPADQRDFFDVLSL